MNRALPGIAALLLLSACFGGLTPDGKYYCATQSGCLSGHICYQNYCCKQDRTTGLCVDHPCMAQGADADKDGYPLCAGDCDDKDPVVYPGAIETCDAKDNDCDGQIDEAVSTKVFKDVDLDGFGNADQPVYLCNPQSTPGLSRLSGDCDDADARRFPGNAELCDGIDNNCNGEVDENVFSSWFLDGDGDGYGRTDLPQQSCVKPDGYSALKDDCDDVSAFVHPNAVELCNGTDDNCDGLTDEGVKVNVWPDVDGDGFGAKGATPQQRCSADTNQAINDLDCDDTRAAVNPSAKETCNGLDDNCSGLVDEGVKGTFWPDADGDGFGAKTGAQAACTATGNLVPNTGDCDDTKSSVNPSASEVCNSVDDNCNGLVDEGLKTTFFRDADVDGFGDAATSVVACPPALSGYVENPLDCADAQAGSYPGAPEICDARDNDCDGVKDNAEQCGPRVDQAELAASWGAGVASGNTSPAGCLANAAGVTALVPVRDAGKFAPVAGNAASISVTDTTGRDFFAYFPQSRNAGWKLSGQQLALQLSGNASGWDTAFKQPLVLFCQSAGSFARFEPAATLIGNAFSPFSLNVPSATATGWTFTGGFSFASSQVNWIEVHLNNGATGSATAWLDDVRFVPQ